MIHQIWQQAQSIAVQTPESRNRYIDFLRAASILCVVFGHWLMASALHDPTTDTVTPISTLEVLPWTQWLSWIFQVMPIFFFVGGYSNALSLQSAEKKNLSYPEWFTGRLHRLLTPLLSLLISWGVIALVMNLIGVDNEKIAAISQMALVPTWFLSIYAMICMLAPASYRFWKKYGWSSFFVYVALAIATDIAFFNSGIQATGLMNYFWVWLAVHHLGFAWHDRRIASPMPMFLIGIAGWALLYALVFIGPYPLAMAGSPAEEVSNSLPPKITLITLGIAQFGLIVAFEKPMQNLLKSLRLWTSTVLISSMIMSIYLWHMTLLLLVIALCWLLGGIGLHEYPGTAEWWMYRPIWMIGLFLLLLPVAQLFSPLERRSRPKDQPFPATLQLVLGTIIAAAGIGIAAMFGYTGNLTSMIFILSFIGAIGGAALCGVRVRH